MTSVFDTPIPATVLAQLDTAVRRPWLENRVEAALSARSGGRIALLIGQPGCGKTTFAAQFALRWNCVCLVLRGGHADGGVTADPKNALVQLGLQLRARYGAEIFGPPGLEIRASARVDDVTGGGVVTGVGIGRVRLSPFRQVLVDSDVEVGRLDGSANAVWIGELSDATAELSVAQLAREAIIDPLRRLAALRPGERVHLVVDALDESPGLAETLPLDAELPENSSWLITTRDGEHLDRFDTRPDGLTRISLADPELHRSQVADAETFLRQRFESATAGPGDGVIRSIAEASEGNFLYLRHFLLDVDEDETGSLLSSVLRGEIPPPRGLDAIYRYLVKNRLHDSVPDDRWQDFRAVLGVLAVAFAPLTGRQLAQHTGVDVAVIDRMVLRARQFLTDVAVRDDLAFTFYHRSFADFLLTQDRARNPIPLQPAVHHHLRIANSYAEWTDRDWRTSDDLYALRHLVDHLAAANTVARPSELVAGGFLRRQWELLGATAARASTMTVARLNASHNEDVAMVDMLVRARELSEAVAEEWESGQFTSVVLNATSASHERLLSGGPRLPWSGFLCAERLLDLGERDRALALLDSIASVRWHGYYPSTNVTSHGFVSEGSLGDYPDGAVADFVAMVAELDAPLALRLHNRLFGALPSDQLPNVQTRWRDVLYALDARAADDDVCRAVVDLTAEWMSKRAWRLGRAGIAEALFALLRRLAPGQADDLAWFATRVNWVLRVRFRADDRWFAAAVGNLAGLAGLRDAAPMGSRLRNIVNLACGKVAESMLDVPLSDRGGPGLLGRHARLLERAGLPRAREMAEVALEACENAGDGANPPIGSVLEGLHWLRHMSEPGVGARAAAVAERLGLADRLAEFTTLDPSSQQMLGINLSRQFAFGRLALQRWRDGQTEIEGPAGPLTWLERQFPAESVLPDKVAQALALALVRFPAPGALDVAGRLMDLRTDQAKDTVLDEESARNVRWIELSDRGERDLLRAELDETMAGGDPELLSHCCVRAADLDPDLAFAWWGEVATAVSEEDRALVPAVMVAAVAERHPDRLEPWMIPAVAPAHALAVCSMWSQFPVLRDATAGLLREIAARFDPTDQATVAKHLAVTAVIPDPAVTAGLVEAIAQACRSLDDKGAGVLAQLRIDEPVAAGPGADLVADLLTGVLDGNVSAAPDDVGFASALRTAAALKHVHPGLSARVHAEAVKWWTQALDAEYQPRVRNVSDALTRAALGAREWEFRSAHQRKMYETTTELARWCAARPASRPELADVRAELGRVLDLDFRALLMAPVADAWLSLGDHDNARHTAELASLSGLQRSGYLTRLRTAPALRDHVIELITRDQPAAELEQGIDELLPAWFTFRLSDGDPGALVERVRHWLSEKQRRGPNQMEPISLAVVSALVVTEGIKFFYAQAGELLKKRRERKEKRDESQAVLPVPPADVFEGELEQTPADFEVVEKFKDELPALWSAVGPYAQGIEVVEASNTALLETTDSLRKIIEAVHGQRMTLKGEPRPESGPVVVGQVEIDDIAGEVTAVLARTVTSGQVSGTVKAKTVQQGGKVVGVQAGDIG